MQGHSEMDEATAIDLSKQMAVMSSEMAGLRTDVGEIKTDIRKMSDEAPVHRINELERWREKVEESINTVPEIKRWKSNTSKALTTLAIGLLIALGGAVFAIVLAR